MNKTTLLTALTAVLAYLAVTEIYDLFVRLLFVIILKIQLTDSTIQIGLISLIAIFSILLLIYFYKIFLKTNNLSVKKLYLLIGLNILIFGGNILAHNLYINHLVEDSDFISGSQLMFVVKWSDWIGKIFPFLALLYFLGTLRNLNKTVANTV